ncbi:GAF domain-containing sensor histidine kinase [Bacillus alkalisoli]|uniref:GAF domain-containing sensor histidine kinase n=1 Tax=Bacillus alkalisoli TaxID=2011008 RepID=UPI0029DE8489|nr:GAF domain-containing sensor histidine kinase [Bacillus alkalisoli]
MASEGSQQIRELLAIKAIAEALNKGTEMTCMLHEVLEKLLDAIDLKTGWIFLIDDKGKYELAASYELPEGLSKDNKEPMCVGECWCVNQYNDGRLKKASNIFGCKRLEDAVKFNWGDTNNISHHATVPIMAGDEKFGLLNVASPNKKEFTEKELALLESVSFQIGTAIKRLKLSEQEQAMSVIAERNRLARDLHDSVNQLLFSLMLTVRGTKEMTDDPEIKQMLEYMQELSQEALQEMRALIWQLRPQGLENGLVSALLNYGKVLNLQVEVDVKGTKELPNDMEECIWRIGQEALNNCKKYASSKNVYINIEKFEDKVLIIIKDNGVGFDYEVAKQLPSLGLSSMKERVASLSGTLEVNSSIGAGTTIHVEIPFKGESVK